MRKKGLGGTKKQEAFTSCHSGVVGVRGRVSVVVL